MRHRDIARILSLASLFVMASADAFAQGNAAEAARNRQERRKNARQRVDDRTDLAALRSIAHDWKTAVDAGDRAKERAADKRLAAWLRREIREEGRERRGAEAERRQARRERNRSRREAGYSGTADDRRDLRDDRRDLRDDRRDAKVARAESVRVRKLAGQLAKMQPDFTQGKATPEQYRQKRTLLGKLLKGERREVRQNRRETREDRRERREDRRERREDR